MEISGLKAIIIGGASGFARATAERIAAGGGSVAILDREESAGAEVASSLVAGRSPLPFSAMVSERALISSGPSVAVLYQCGRNPQRIGTSRRAPPSETNACTRFVGQML